MTDNVGTLCLYYPQQDRVINFQKLSEGIVVEIKSKKRVVAHVILNESQAKQLKEWLQK